MDKKRLRFTRELAEEFYSEHADKPFFRSSSSHEFMLIRLCCHPLELCHPSKIRSPSMVSRSLIEFMTSGDCMALVLGR